MADVVMPRLSDSMEEGTILRWLKAEGDQVARGEELVEIETDKATMTYEADTAGVLSILVPAGETLAVGVVIARLGEAGEAPAAQVTAPEPVAEAATPATPATGERVKASPVARRIARETGVDLEVLTGSGPGGRIVRADVEASGAAVPAPSSTAPTRTGAAKGSVEVVELTRIQQTIARRMAESKATVPDFQVRVEVDVEEAVALRTQMKAQLGHAPSLNDFVVKACGLALREHPRVNGAYRDGHFELHSRVNVGVAVAAEDALVVPTIFDADTTSLTAIATDARALAAKVRDATITPPEVAGGTFTVSNLGMLGVSSFTAVINPGQAAILAVGAAIARPAVRDDQVLVRRIAELTLACDHRIIYGADAARFLGRVRELLEAPLGLLR